jgi:O-succinylbenzoate synthase
MIIHEITMRHLRMTLRSPFETSFGSIHTRDCILLEAHAEGILGYGECVADRDPGFSYETTQTAWHVLRDFLIPAILGSKLENAKDLQEQLHFVRGHPMAKAGLEMTLWDLHGKLHDLSLRQMLKGPRADVEVGVSVGIQETPQALVDTVGSYISEGYKRIKIKIKPGRDVPDTQAVREAYPDLLLQVDANSAYTLETASVLKPLDEFGLLLIEQPLAPDDLWDHHHLQKEFHTPICLDESIISPRHARQAMEMDACRVINIKAGRVGGLSKSIEIHNLCSDQDVPVWCGGMLETGVGRAANLALASLPNFRLPGDISATERYYEQDITFEKFTLNPDSTITVPTGPGLGVTIDMGALADVTLEETTLRG